MFKLPEKTERQSSIKFDCEEGSEWKWKEATWWWDPGRLNLGSPEEIAYNWFLQSVTVSSSFLGLTSDIEITEHTQQDNAIVTTGPATQYQATKNHGLAQLMWKNWQSGKIQWGNFANQMGNAGLETSVNHCC